MALLKYFKKIPTGTADVPDPSGMLSSTVPLETIKAANREVRAIQLQQAKRAGSKRGQYNKANAKNKATIGAYASLHGVTS